MIRINGTPVEPKRVLSVLAAVAYLLVLFHIVAMQIYFNDDLGIRGDLRLRYWHVAMLDLDEEESFGTWFSSLQLAFAGLLALTAAWASRRDLGTWARWWIVLGIGLLFLSVDEVAGMHEYMNTMMDDVQWTVVGFPILLIVGFSFLPFLWRLPRRTALLLLAAGAVFGAGAVGVESLSGNDLQSLAYNMSTALEEGLEIAGVMLCVYALLAYLSGIGVDVGAHRGTAGAPDREPPFGRDSDLDLPAHHDSTSGRDAGQISGATAVIE